MQNFRPVDVFSVGFLSQAMFRIVTRTVTSRLTSTYYIMNWKKVSSGTIPIRRRSFSSFFSGPFLAFLHIIYDHNVELEQFIHPELKFYQSIEFCIYKLSRIRSCGGEAAAEAFLVRQISDVQAANCCHLKRTTAFRERQTISWRPRGDQHRCEKDGSA